MSELNPHEANVKEEIPAPITPQRRVMPEGEGETNPRLPSLIHQSAPTLPQRVVKEEPVPSSQENLHQGNFTNRPISNLHDDPSGSVSMKIKLRVTGTRVTSASMVDQPERNHYDLRPHTTVQYDPATLPLPLKAESNGTTASGLLESNEVSAKNALCSKNTRQRKSAPQKRSNQPKKNKKPSHHQDSRDDIVSDHHEPRSGAVAPSESSVDDPAPDRVSNPKKKRTRVKRAASERVNQVTAFDNEDYGDSFDQMNKASDFWTEMAEYRSEFTALDVNFCTIASGGIVPDNSPYLDIPQLGPHYREHWIEEDDREAKKLLEPSHRPSKYRKQDDDGAKASRTGPGGEKSLTESQESPLPIPKVGTFTSRLLAAFAQESIIGQSFYNRPGEFDMEMDDYIIPHGSIPSRQVQVRTLTNVESRLASELKTLGLLTPPRKPSDVSTPKGKDEGLDKSQNDEVLAELEKLQGELVSVTRENAAYRESTLLPRVQSAIQLSREENHIRTQVFEREEQARLAFREILKRKREKEKEKKSEPATKKQRLGNVSQGRTLPAPKPEPVHLPPPEEPSIPKENGQEAENQVRPIDAMDIDEEVPASIKEDQEDEGDAMRVNETLEDARDEVDMPQDEANQGDGTAQSDDMNLIELDLAEDLIRDD